MPIMQSPADAGLKLSFPAGQAAPAGGPMTPPPEMAREWLLTNGMGGFAMGTVGGWNSRRYHSFLIHALNPPVDRINTVTSLGEQLVLEGATFDLNCQTFHGPRGGSILHPNGWQHLREFEKAVDSCRWVWEVKGVQVVRELRLVDGAGGAAVDYQITGAQGRAVSLRILPFVAMRDFHGLRLHGAMPGLAVFPEGRAVTLRQADSAAWVRLEADEGQFVHHPHWWYRFRYEHETLRGQDDTEDLLVPGYFERRLTADGAWSLRIAAQPIEESAWHARGRAARVRAMATHIARGLTLNDNDQRRLGLLAQAADDFIVHRSVQGAPMSTIIAGYPWFADWGRDTMIALPGLLLETGRLNEALGTLRAFAAPIADGLVPNRFDDYGADPHYNTVDASLWFIQACLSYLRAGGDKAAFEAELLPACLAILRAYAGGTRYDIRMDSDGLISAGNPATQLTWMDAARDGVVFTPRYGKAVEINALWISSLAGLSDVLTAMARAGDAGRAADAQWCAARAAEARANFEKVFWSPELGHLIDHIAGDRADRSLRPNQLLAVSLPGVGLSRPHQQAVMKLVRDKLLTPAGPRTLPETDPAYHAAYQGSMFQRDEAYHQGTIWPWLIGPMIGGWLEAFGRSAPVLAEARTMLEGLMTRLQGPGLGQLHEIFEASPPHRPEGCPAQAWSIAETLRAWKLLHA